MDDNMRHDQNEEQSMGQTTGQTGNSANSFEEQQHEAGTYQSGSGNYNASENAGTYQSGSGNYNSANAGSYHNGEARSDSHTGNGNYQYNDGYRSAYSGSYGSNGQHSDRETYQNGYTGYQGAYQNGNNGNNGSSGNRAERRAKKKGNAGKIVLAVGLAMIFGVCAGAGAWGINRIVGGGVANQITESSKDADETTQDDNSEKESSSKKSASVKDAGESSQKSDSKQSASLKTTSGSASQYGVTDVVNEVMPSIVSVYNNYTQKTQDIFGQTYSQEGTSTGSGIIIAQTDDELLIATNNHVVDGEDSLQVQFIDETTADANIKGTDADNDLAVIAVDLDELDEDTRNTIVVATLGDSDELQVGETVIAIGNALGYGQSVTTGVVSALERERTNDTGYTSTFIQTDAAINPGNSGGALVDMDGHVIGINSSKTGGVAIEGMGYAIPSARAIPIIQDLMNQSTKSRVSEDEQGYLGITGVSVTSQVSQAYNMPQGVYVDDMVDGTGAADSDLQKGDIITAINSTKVGDMSDLQDQLRYYAAGTTVTLTVQRADGDGNYEEKEVDVTLSDTKSMEKAREGLRQSQSGSSRSSQSQNGDNGNSGNNSGNNGFYAFPWNQW